MTDQQSSYFSRLDNHHPDSCPGYISLGHFANVTQSMFGKLTGNDKPSGREDWPTRQTVSNWKNLKSQPERTDRTRLLAIIAAFVEVGCIKDTDGANEFLSEINCASLDESEINQLQKILPETLSLIIINNESNKSIPLVKVEKKNLLFMIITMGSIGLIFLALILFNTSKSVPEPESRNTIHRIQSRVIDGIEMVYVPPGCFLMGNATGDPDRDEDTVHEQCIENGFWIDRFEVSNAQYGNLPDNALDCDFLRDSNFEPTTTRAGGDEPDRPRNCVTWFEARNHCESRAGRLPTESEWEYAAKGADNWIYPWGNDFDGSLGNIRLDDIDNFANSVSAYPNGVSWVGAYNMSGGVWEWTSSVILPYPYDHNDGREDPNNMDERRVLRGGSWDNYPSSATTHRRGQAMPDTRWNAFGFRCVIDGI